MKKHESVEEKSEFLYVSLMSVTIITKENVTAEKDQTKKNDLEDRLNENITNHGARYDALVTRVRSTKKKSIGRRLCCKG